MPTIKLAGPAGLTDRDVTPQALRGALSRLAYKVCATHPKVVSGVRGRSKRASAMTRKEIAVEFVIPTAIAIALGLVLAFLLSAATFSS